MSDKSDELDEILQQSKLYTATDGKQGITVAEAKSALHAYMLKEFDEIVGEDEDTTGGAFPSEKHRNELRAVQRKAIADRWGE